MRMSLLIAAALVLFAGAASPARAQPADPPAHDTADLAKQLANPVSSLISVPFQNNWDCCYGPAKAGFYTLNIQPVIPMSVSRDWNLIVRTIVPIVDHPSTGPGVSGASGFSDITQSFFFSPKAAVGGWVLGAGPVIVYPLGGERLGSQKWSAGPTVVALKQTGHLTVGVLANQVWSFAGPSSRADVDALFLQPFLNYTLPDTTAFTLNTESSYDWTSRTWTVPLIFTVGKIFHFGGQLVQLSGSAKDYVVSPSGGPEWGLRATATLLFPKH